MYKVNLLPPKLQREGIIDIRRLVIIAGTTLFVATIFGAYGAFLVSFFTLKGELVTTKQQLTSLVPVISRVEKIKEERKLLEAALKEYDSIFEKRKSWYDLLSEIGYITPVDLWLTELEICYKPGQEKEQKGKNKDTANDSQEKADKGSSRVQEKFASFPRPNLVVFKGFSRSIPSIGVFMNNLFWVGYFEGVELERVSPESEGIRFEVVARLRGGN